MASVERPAVDDIRQVLRGVIDPELGSDIVDLGMVKGVSIDEEGAVRIDIGLTTLGCPLRAQIQRDVRARVETLPGIASVRLDWTELSPEEKSHTMSRARWNVVKDAPETMIPATTKVICIASGKGGVGKSSVTVNLAAALAADGLTVGVLDADIWGFSIPRMLGVDGRIAGAGKGSKKMVPHRRACGSGTLEVVSMGFLVEDEQDALMWRGLMLNRAVQHFLEDVAWGDLDYLVIDMPPGTGDVQMGLARLLPRAEMIIVTTPAVSAQKVAARAATMARKCYLRVAGVVENMSVFVTPAGERFEVFGSGGGAALAAEVGAPLLARIPIEAAVAHGGDVGEPIALANGPAATSFRDLARVVRTDVIPLVDLASCSARLFEAMELALDEAGESGAGRV